MNKVKAYTLMEMIVVMLISSIIVSMSYTVFSKMIVLNKRVGEIYKKNYSVILFNRLLVTDFLCSEQVIKAPDGFSCQYKDHTVFYELNDQLIRKQYSLSDTLLSMASTTIAYEYVDSNKTIVKGIVISGEYDQESLNMTFYKEYGSDLLMKLDEQRY
jgi:prepilin-type N-terminal cleavage/methylation domain-containing protein